MARRAHLRRENLARQHPRGRVLHAQATTGSVDNAAALVVQPVARDTGQGYSMPTYVLVGVLLALTFKSLFCGITSRKHICLRSAMGDFPCMDREHSLRRDRLRVSQLTRMHVGMEQCWRHARNQKGDVAVEGLHRPKLPEEGREQVERLRARN